MVDECPALVDDFPGDKNFSSVRPQTSTTRWKLHEKLSVVGEFGKNPE
jgi:hypothetical protein